MEETVNGITIPALDDERILRHVEIDGRYRLLLWDTYRMWDTYRTDRFGKSILGYAFGRKNEAPIFVGEDYGCAPVTRSTVTQPSGGFSGF